MEINIKIDRGVRGHPSADWLRGVVEEALRAQDVGDNVEVGLLITTQEKVHQLNKGYRNKDVPTDVLSFYMDDASAPTTFVTPPDGIHRLGEVIISYPQAVLQAKEHQHSIKREIATLIIHGLLHLLGYDHEKPGERRRMQATEKAILAGIQPD